MDKYMTINPHDPKDVAEAISKYVNNMSHKPQALAEELVNDHRTLIQCKAKVFVKFFELLAEQYNKNWWDARNEASCKFAKKIMDNTTEADRAFPFI